MQLLNVLGYKERKLPLKYLGVPLISTKLTSPDCFILVDNIMDKAKICMNRKYTSRLQLIKSIFFSIHSFEGCYCENHFFVEIFFYGIVVILLQVVLKLLRIRFSYQKR
jgi:hypothetical protein